MRWYYRWQQRFAITRAESNVLLTLAALFAVGLVVRYVQGRAAPVSTASYAEAREALASPTTGTTAEADSLQTPAVEPNGGDSSVTGGVEGRIELNTATAADLQRLPRIGPKMAERVLAYRHQNGPFRRVQDLLGVRGIGPKTLSRLEPLVTVRVPAPPDTSMAGQR